MANIFLPKGTTDLGTLASLNTSSLVVSEGGQIVTAGLDQSGLAASVGSIFVQGQSTVGFGSATAGYFKAGISGVFQLNSFGGSFYYIPVGAGSVTTCARLKNIGANRLYLSGGQVDSLECSGSSYSYVSDSTLVPTLALSGGQIEQLYNATANTTWYITNGSLTTGRGFTTAYVGGGQIFVSREDSSQTAPAGGTLNQGGGSIVWRGGAITTIRGVGGMFDARDVPGNLTITNLIATREYLRRSYFKSRNFTITISNLTVLADELDSVIQ